MEEPDHQSDDGGTLNAIGRALLQMQQGSQSQQPQMSPSSNQQIFFRTSATDSNAASQSGEFCCKLVRKSTGRTLGSLCCG